MSNSSLGIPLTGSLYSWISGIKVTFTRFVIVLTIPVDRRATLLLSMLPQELLGTSMYEYYHVDDIVGLTEAHKAALQSTETITTPVQFVGLVNFSCHEYFM